jgi:anti-sigma regulatory factor (Ser/Thr protein kinase)
MDLTGVAVPVSDRSAIGSVRRAALAACQALDLDEDDSGRAAIVATELASNVLKHGQGGWCFVAPSEFRGVPAVSMVSFDRGPGIRNPAVALADGYSTTGTPGTGLGAIRRLSLVFDLYSQPEVGVTMAARVGPLAPSGSDTTSDVGALLRAKPGQDVSGDTWSARRAGPGLLVMVADGLGHGPEAAAAARAAATAFQKSRQVKPVSLVEEIHEALLHTRGAAVAVALVDPAAGRVLYAGIGNISGRLVELDQARSLVSMNGTAGQQARSLREFEYDAPAGSLLVLHSDGLSARWSLEDYPGLAERDPALIAGVLFRDFGRDRDDAVVVAVRVRGGSPVRGGRP